MDFCQIELSGHIIDSLILPKAMDIIMDMGGDFKVLDFEIGKLKTDISYTKIEVSAKSSKRLKEIIAELSEIGASVSELKNANLVEVVQDKVAPAEFYSTTNHLTFVYVDDEWLEVENIEMDCMIVVEPQNKKAYCKPLNYLKKGEKIVVGYDGIKTVPPERSRGKQGLFEFMNSDVSSEKPLMSIVDDIANQIKEIKENNGKILLVGGPAIAHTGSAPLVAQLIREGYIDVIFAGNALATHDIENALYGTSLGICTENGWAVARGHRHHIKAINEINKHGSIRAAVENGALKSGIMYECIKNDVPYVLAGSIRDDGPLPDVIRDVIEAQDEMRKYAQEVDMVIMVATMLHSIATGNILPSRVKTVCIDVNPATVTKLADRGTAQAKGIVTDVGAFLPLLYERLLELK